MAELLDELRPRAFAIAYRMLGRVSEAEDVVQEALLRLHGVLEAGEEIEVPRPTWPPSSPGSASTGSARRRCDGRPTSANGCRSRW